MCSEQQHRINISAPNLINICVDEKQNDEISGRMYHCYSIEPVRFANIIELIRVTENLFDAIAFPQASTKTRKFVEEESDALGFSQKPERVVHQEEVVKNTGKIGTFITTVRFRQNSTWQGEFYWVEQEQMHDFTNILDFIRQLDCAL